VCRKKQIALEKKQITYRLHPAIILARVGDSPVVASNPAQLKH
jgi:hypothetical protein